MSDARGWHSRGYLPHLDDGDVPLMVNWRLADAVPAEAIRRWHLELQEAADSEQRKEVLRKIETYADQGAGSCVLGDPRAAKIIQENLLEHHGRTIILHAWVVMPNHVHALFTPQKTELSSIMRSIKGATAASVNRLLGREGRLWQPDYLDRKIRNQEHFERAKKYIEWNPVKAKLCSDPALWYWGSASAEVQRRLRDLTLERIP